METRITINIKNSTNNVRIGSSQSALVETSDAISNTILGKQAGQAITAGNENVIVNDTYESTGTRKRLKCSEM